jgi:hypothetical protein
MVLMHSWPLVFKVLRYEYKGWRLLPGREAPMPETYGERMKAEVVSLVLNSSVQSVSQSCVKEFVMCDNIPNAPL